MTFGTSMAKQNHIDTYHVLLDETNRIAYGNGDFNARVERLIEAFAVNKSFFKYTTYFGICSMKTKESKNVLRI